MHKMRQMLAIARKELEGFFGSPMALIFVGVFLAVTLFSFFWVDTFFARGIADVRPLFRWMPILMIFLVAALTMRQWSEEQRAGTLEVLLTLPVPQWQLVLGKFLAAMALVAISLALTLFLPITVALLGNLDWGPVVGGYLAALLLASAYTAIGLAISSRTDNQIVALILTGLVCGLFYLIGTAGVTDFFGDAIGEILRAIGSGSRFESVQRGVIDLRDLVYYVSLTGLFLTLNVISLDSKRWSKGPQSQAHRRGLVLTSVLLTANLLLLNIWLHPLRSLRLDLTQHREYSLSRTTRDLLGNLQEPLLIRGYFSERTHPLLAPLVPRIRDLLQEYAIASGGMVQMEVIDPAQDPDKEAEANQTYGIQPMPFQVAGRYETSIINSYFDILIRYGDQSVTLGFQDLIEVEPLRNGTIDVRLRNLEYDLTSSIRKVVYGFQSVDAVLASLDSPARLTAYVTGASLPDWLAEAPAAMESVAAEIAAQSTKFEYTLIDPDAPGSPVSRQMLYEQYGLQPLRSSLFSADSYYLYMVLEAGGQTQLIYPSGEVTEAAVRSSIESALKRSTSGFLKVVGVWTPPATPTQDMFGRQQQPISSWNDFQDALRQEYEVRSIDLARGQVPTDVDVLVVVSPRGMSAVERFAIDQYLMRGGALVLAAGNYGIQADPMQRGLQLEPLKGGLRDLLASYGIDVQESLVLDAQNEPFPVPVVRQVGQFQVQEIQAIAFPFFVDVRPDGMNKESPIVSNLAAVTLNWASPVVVDQQANAGRQAVTLIESTANAWLQADTNMQPNFQLYPEIGFPVSGTPQRYPLAVSVQGSFQSAFKGQASPLEAAQTGDGQQAPLDPLPTIDVSPESARLLVIGSGEFLDDVVFSISSQIRPDRYLNSIKLLQNAVAWSTEEQDLLAIRARGTASRVLIPLSEGAESFWEGLNYVAALVALGALAVLWSARRRNQQPMALLSPEQIAADREEVSS